MVVSVRNMVKKIVFQNIKFKLFCFHEMLSSGVLLLDIKYNILYNQDLKYCWNKTMLKHSILNMIDICFKNGRSISIISVFFWRLFGIYIRNTVNLYSHTVFILHKYTKSPHFPTLADQKSNSSSYREDK